MSDLYPPAPVRSTVRAGAPVGVYPDAVSLIVRRLVTEGFWFVGAMGDCPV